ncbi:4-hydroxythreonine-4-phosphate dehydrogenase [Rhodoblastus acidophilus]|uniref:4-hydroxythreonine-4-phosphate dehydrogenase n=1 Tax=Rhodoblastus acidophilus TaxID=1074 RepID=A0A212RFV9_RHOAC|nr:4-hydroxythreonine-4-phosphate dehydrogenase PdxA [Rhodoblastus acidophilus]PPQ39637.1 4-hydroxythreonine-4-phosphate dehydrogenase PdxA [Rhodoblastus acidophilus]RAI24419.1 4-hydroxythreonine-4-phosphate dehydrogenase PdxA [Rhodoblastus acidophilus]SNB71254.1 4-hydroxythreonine-4-phosphate dehydrogenase [Rhodoblastus acidophilus]
MTAAAPLCLTQGDPSGIGPDLALALHAGLAGLPPFFLLADPDLLRRRAAQLRLNVAIAECEPEQARGLFPHALPVVPLRHRARGAPGAPDPADAPATVESIERAVDYLAQGRARAMVTNPIAKSVLYAAGFEHPGHTEFLGELAAAKFGRPVRPVMMIWSRELAVVPATIHIPLSAVAAVLREDDLVEIGRIVAAALAHDFGVAAPRLAFCGLNPHAGENGAMGREDIDIVAPAVARLAAEGVDARGPLPADTMFHAEARAGYDAAIGMYHDQVLIPAKTLAFDTGVNVTLGLPFIRTSPDHGTAFSLAGTLRARTSSLAEAILLADRMARARAGA